MAPCGAPRQGAVLRIAVTTAGAVLVLVALRDMFHTLFHPMGRGSLNRAVSRATSGAFCRAAHRFPGMLELRGPTVVVAVIATWTVLVGVGWTLVYWPWLPGAYLFSPGLEPAEQGDFLDALYLSLVTMSTLGYGDITPAEGWLRVVAPLQALVGFALLSAAISWVLSIYPALSRRRSFVDRATSLIDATADWPTEEGRIPPGALDEMAQRLTAVRTDLRHFPATRYFGSADEQRAFGERLSGLAGLARSAEARRSLELRLAGRRLHDVLKGTAATIGGSVVADADEVVSRSRGEPAGRGTTSPE